MKLSKNSWWYRVYNCNTEWLPTHYTNYYRPENLCHFIRVVLFWVPLKIVSIISIPLACLAGIIFLFTEIYMGAPLLYWSLVAVGVGFPLSIYFQEFLPRPSRPVIPKQVSVIGEWVKAKKQKICPFIEFIE